jgi:hypothetical protein
VRPYLKNKAIPKLKVQDAIRVQSLGPPKKKPEYGRMLPNVKLQHKGIYAYKLRN